MGSQFSSLPSQRVDTIAARCEGGAEPARLCLVTVPVGRDTIATGCDLLYDRQCERHVDLGSLFATDLNGVYADRLPVGRSERIPEATLPMKANPL